MPDEIEIAALEEQLMAAMLSSNVAVLDSMLAAGPLGTQASIGGRL